MKKNLSFIIIAALLSLNIVTLFKLNSIENYMHSHHNQIISKISSVDSDVDNIYRNIDSILDKQASIIDSYDIKFSDEINKDNLTVPVQFTVVPKEYSEGLTVSVQLGDEMFLMQKNGVSFVKTIDFNIFEHFKPKVVISQNGIQKIESIEEYYDFQDKYILQINGMYNGSQLYNSGKYKYKNGKVELQVTNTQVNVPEKISIVCDVNGKIINEQQVELSGIGKEEFTTNFFYQEIDELELGANDKLTIYANVQDKCGINYKYVVLYNEIDSQGQLIHSMPEWSSKSVIEISDKDGNILYVPEFY